MKTTTATRRRIYTKRAALLKKKKNTVCDENKQEFELQSNSVVQIYTYVFHQIQQVPIKYETFLAVVDTPSITIFTLMLHLKHFESLSDRIHETVLQFGEVRGKEMHHLMDRSEKRGRGRETYKVFSCHPQSLTLPTVFHILQSDRSHFLHFAQIPTYLSDFHPHLQGFVRSDRSQEVIKRCLVAFFSHLGR